jgi:hypothetical protein
MTVLPTPTRTPLARQVHLHPAHRALLGAVDGRRNIVALESVARVMGLQADTLDQLHQQGLIVFGASVLAASREAQDLRPG